MAFDCIKLAMDGVQTRDDGSLIAAFNQEETTSMVNEAHRLGKKVVVHARGKGGDPVCRPCRRRSDLPTPIISTTSVSTRC